STVRRGGSAQARASDLQRASTAPPWTMPGQLWSPRGAVSRPRPSGERGAAAVSGGAARGSTGRGLGRRDALLPVGHVGGHSTTAAFAAPRVTTSAYDILVSGPFARTMLTNFFFFASLNGYVLLPLYVHQQGGTEASIGIVQGMFSAAGILCQPLVGAW